MKTATSGFISAISDSCPYHTVKFYYNGTELDITPKTFNYYGLMIGGENINIGETCASHIEFELYNPTITLENKEVQVKGGVEVNGSIEYVSLGYFTVTKPSIESEVYKYTAYDRMIGLERLYVSSLANPTTSTVMNEIATQLGYTFASTITEITLDVNKIKGYTYREMLGFISALCGANCIFNGNGEIEFKWFVQPTSELATIGTDRLYENGLELNSDEDITVGYIKCATGGKEEVPIEDTTTENTEIIDGEITEDEVIEEPTTETVDVILSVGSGNFGINISNPLMTQEVLQNIYDTYFSNFTFRPCKVNMLGNILLECGDIVTVNNGTNTYTVPIMSIQHSIDGGVVTNIETIAQNETEQEISYTSPTVKLMDRVYYEILEANKAIINDLTANTITTEYLTANFTKIFQANIENGAITNAMIGTEAVKTSQIADGSITDAKIVELTANKIKAGTLDVERLIVTQNNQKYLFHVNEDGTTEYQKLNGNILEDRSITADKIVANAITAKEIASRTITANKIVSRSITANEIAANTITSAEIKSGSITASKIDVNDLFAQDITATGTITGLKVSAGEINGCSYNFLDGEGGTMLSLYQDGNYTTFEGYDGSSLKFEGCRVISLSSNISLSISSQDVYISGNLNCDSISVGKTSYLNTALYLGDGTDSSGTRYYINSNGTGRFNTLYEDGTALSSKYASASHTAHSSVTSNAGVYADTNMRIGNNRNTSTEYALATYWKDGSVHNLASRASDGLTSFFGWAGSSSYATICNLRSRTCRYTNASGTTNLSDVRLKDNFTSLDKWSSFFDAIEPCAFKMKTGNSGRFHIGYKAQQIEQALVDNGLTTQDFGGFIKMPYLPDSDNEEVNKVYEEVGIKEGEDEYGLIYTEFTALNTYEIQKLKTKVKEQQSEIEILEQRLENLEQKVGGNSAS